MYSHLQNPKNLYWVKLKFLAIYTSPILTLKNPMETLWQFIAAWTKFFQGAIWNDLGPNDFYNIWKRCCSFQYWANCEFWQSVPVPSWPWKIHPRPQWDFIAAWIKFLQGAIWGDLGPNDFHKIWWGFCSCHCWAKKKIHDSLYPSNFDFKEPITTPMAFYRSLNHIFFKGLSGVIWGDCCWRLEVQFLKFRVQGECEALRTIH